MGEWDEGGGSAGGSMGIRQPASKRAMQPVSGEPANQPASQPARQPATSRLRVLGGRGRPPLESLQRLWEAPREEERGQAIFKRETDAPTLALTSFCRSRF